MLDSEKLMCFLLVGALMGSGCTGLSVGVGQNERSQAPSVSIPQTIEELAGSWEYVDPNGTFPITLDVQGGGRYEWKDGRFETIELKDGVWKGKWHQAENDREGGFALIFSEGSTVATGEWWYTRIGENDSPLEPGGSFTMKPFPGVMTTEK